MREQGLKVVLDNKICTILDLNDHKNNNIISVVIWL
jgi:hypothetical protein